MVNSPRIISLVEKEISDLTTYLLEVSLSNDQNYPYRVNGPGNKVSIQYSTSLSRSAVLKDRPYSDLYIELLRGRAFNVLMLDGAMLQLFYEFQEKKLVRSRLAFFPSPDLLQFQNSPEEYLEDFLYADIVDQRIVTVPLRFDYDDRPGVAQPGDHPRSHLTLGQYSGCRIATTAPITPHLFVEFVLRCFYNTPAREVSAALPRQVNPWARSITEAELSVVHIGVPE